MIRACELVCVNNTHDPIPLPDGQPVLIGRSPQTRIIDPRCSRNQLEITSNWKKKQVTVKQIGGNSSAIDGTELETGRLCTLQTGAILFLLTGQYPHKVQFCVKEEDKNSPKGSHKASADNKHKNSGSVKRPAPSDDDDGKNVKPVKKARTESSDSHKASADNKHKNSGSVKRSTPSDDDDSKNVKPVKKAKTESSSNTLKGKISDNDDDDSHVKSVEEKLRSLKKSAKDENNKKKSENNHHGDSKHGKDKSQSEKKEGTPAAETKWMQYDKLYVCNMKGVIARRKIAGFDIDSTIITTQSGNVFPKHPGDWRILYPDIPGKLKKLHSEGYKVVFFTNQLGVAKGKQKIEDLQEKFCNVAVKMGVPVQILVSTGGGIFRKPCLGMWNHLKEKDNDGIKINREESFYVGDAAGRPEKWAAKKKKDFSSSDRLFALNAGIPFYTPEEYFLGQKKAPFSMPDFDPKKVSSSDTLTDPKDALIVSTKKEVVVFVGFPASGKSFFANTYMVPKGYDYVNRDTLGSWQKCVNKCTRSIQEGSSVVIDNTNPDVESRARYIECAKRAGVQCRCFMFTTSHYQARHNEKFREITDKTHKPINDMIMNSFKSKYKEPEVSEGFTEVVKINFVPRFSNSQEEKLYKQYLLEK